MIFRSLIFQKNCCYLRSIFVERTNSATPSSIAISAAWSFMLTLIKEDVFRQKRTRSNRYC